MLSECIFIVCNHFVVNMGEYIVHILSHNNRIPCLYKEHRKHHVIDYPPSRFMRGKDELIEPTKKHYIVIGTVYYGIAYFLLPYTYYSIFLFQTSLYLFIINELHSHYHLKGSPLEKYGWFLKKRRLHHIHHIQTHKNFNLVFFTSDHMNDSYLESYNRNHSI